MRKSKASFIGLVLLFLIVMGVGCFYLQSLAEDSRKRSAAAPTPSFVAPPLQLSEAGPYGTNVRSSFCVDDLSINLKASRLYMKNSNTLGFSNALLKKLVARDLELEVKRAGVVILSLTKAYQEMPADMKTFRIDHPRIHFPLDLNTPDRILIDKNCRQITLWHGTDKEVWDLSAG